MKISGRLGVKDSLFYIPVFMLLSLFIHSFVSLLTDQIFVLYILLGKQKLKGYRHGVELLRQGYPSVHKVEFQGIFGYLHSPEQGMICN